LLDFKSPYSVIGQKRSVLGSNIAGNRSDYQNFIMRQKLCEQMGKMNGIAPFESLLRNVRYAWRVLHRNPGYALLAILTLGLGIGANTAIFTVINGVLLRPLPYAHAGQIVHLDQTAAKLGRCSSISEDRRPAYAAKSSRRTAEGCSSIPTIARPTRLTNLTFYDIGQVCWRRMRWRNGRTRRS
jgi:hypothetical protein